MGNRQQYTNITQSITHYLVLLWHSTDRKGLNGLIVLLKVKFSIFLFNNTINPKKNPLSTPFAEGKTVRKYFNLQSAKVELECSSHWMYLLTVLCFAQKAYLKIFL